jgi:N-acyl-D-amino-acid deacylase
MGFAAGPANEAQMTKMKEEVVKAMDEGAIGVSSGLIYPPGSYASTEELIALTHPAGDRDGFYFSHIRGEGDTLLDAISEAIRVGRETGTAVQISHFKVSGERNWDKVTQALDLIDEANAAGMDVTADMYPYLAGSTSLVSLLPEWAQEGSKEETLNRLSDAETRKKMTNGIPKKPEYEGRFIADLAADAAKSPHDWVFDALLEAELNARMILFMMSEENRKVELPHPLMMIGTDGYGLAAEGPASRMATHPRSYGTYPHVLGHYVRELGIVTLEEAVWKMSGFPAKKLRWKDRGLVQKGYKADLVVLNPETVASPATYEDPHQYPTGIHHVIVNGKLVIHDLQHTQARSGNVLDRS